MKPPETALRELVSQWVEKARDDFEAAAHLLGEGDRLGGIVAFHCQQAVEKYLKALPDVDPVRGSGDEGEVERLHHQGTKTLRRQGLGEGGGRGTGQTGLSRLSGLLGD
jgi:hypothetical protein